MPEGFDRAVGLLRDCRTAHGFRASLAPRANRRRVWARDGVIMGWAALMSGAAVIAHHALDGTALLQGG